MFSQDQYSQARISDVGPWNGVITRAQSTVDRFYMAFVFGPNDYRIFLRKDGLYYPLSLGSTETWVAGDIIRLEAVGLNPVQLTLFRNGNPVLTYTDTTENLVGGTGRVSGETELTRTGIGMGDSPSTDRRRVCEGILATALGVSRWELTASTDGVMKK
jgi:hypothetical protein